MINTFMTSKVRKATTRITLFVILYLAFFVHLSGQTYPFTNISKDEGLSSPKIYCIIQDIDDYIWLGPGSGLDLFDGKIIEPVTLEDGIWPGGVRCLMEDSQGIIWAGHLNGKISYYDGAAFHRISLDSLAINSDITSFQEIDGRIWFTTSAHGAYSAVFDKNAGIFQDVKQYRGKEGLSDQVTSSYINPRGELFCIAPDIGIRKYVKEEDNFILFKPEGITNHFSTICMLEDSRGNGWYGTYNNGLLYLDKDKMEPRFYDMFDIIGNNWVSYLTEDSKGRVWVGTWGGGVSAFDKGNGVNYDDSNGLGAQKILAIMEDREGNILIASYDNGLFIFKGDHFVNYVNNDRITMFSNNDINALCEDNSSRLWLGNDDGITLLDPDTKQFWLYNSEDFSLGKEIVAIQKDNTGNIWIATRFNGIYRYNFSANTFSRSWEVNQIFNKSPQISSMVVDQENNLWIGTADGVGVWNISLEIGVQYTQGDGLASNSIKTLFVDRDGFVWIGSEGENGLTRFNPNTVQFSVKELKNNISPSSIAQTDDGTIWLGTTSGVYSLVNDSISEHISVRNGLLSNDIQLLQPDRKGSLYIGTNFGLNRYDLSTKNITAFTEKNGFTGVQANLNASILSDNGHLWFGTEKGVSCLRPELISISDIQPLTHIKGLTVMLEPKNMGADMKLSYNERSLIFEYYSICVTNPDAVKYKAMLEGAEPDWVDMGDLTRAAYSSLSPGKYIFKVKAVNSNGVWNTEPETFAFTIKPPFYFSTPFIMSMAILIIIAIYMYIKIRERKLVMEKQILEEKVEERTAEVVEKSKVIEEKNRDITASIRYAERIQMAMLPPEDSFKETFVLFRPKDIVSGDFYWMYDNGDMQFLAAVDCTGHGVPGAFMSIIGSNSLTKIVREYNITQPAAILDLLNSEVTKSLLQRGETVINDGMDLALISFNKKKGTVEYAGAYNPLVMVRDGKHITIKADRFPIGMAQSGKKKFTNNEVEVQSGDMLYMFSDGYADQFGGADCKKFKTLNLKNEFLKIYKLPVEAQKDHLVGVLEDWMGGQSQIDDILVIGTRIP